MAIALSVAYTATPLAAGTKLEIQATKQVSAGRTKAPRGAYRSIFTTAAAAASPANILASYTPVFGALISGRKIFFRLVPISSTGVAGVPFETSIVIT